MVGGEASGSTSVHQHKDFHHLTRRSEHPTECVKSRRQKFQGNRVGCAELREDGGRRQLTYACTPLKLGVVFAV